MSVKEGRQKSAASRPAKSAKSNSPVTLKKQAWTAFNERNVSPSTDDAKASTKLFRSGLARNSVESSKSSLRSSTGSCHDACKFGCHGTLADSNGTAKFGGKSPAKKVCKVGAAKLSKPAISRIAVVKSPVRSRNSVAPVNKSVTKTPRESLGSVNGRVQNTVNGRNQNAVNSRANSVQVQEPRQPSDMAGNSTRTETSNEMDRDSKPETNRRGLTSSSEHEASKTLDAKTLRRLAQNREAARKSRLRKKAYVQQLETSRIKLSQIEQDLQRARSQGLFIGGSALLNDQGHAGGLINGPLSSGAAMFDMEYSRWLEEQHRHMDDLRAALQAHLPDNDLRLLLDNCLSHYDEVFRLKSIAAKTDVFHLVSGMWKTAAERCFMWMGGFRPSELLKILIPQLEPLTEQQFLGICNLQQSSQQAEDALSQGMEALQQSLSETIAAGSLSSPSNVANYMGQMAIAMGKLANLEGFVRQADNLRQQTLHQLHRLLTTRQAARCLLSIGEYFTRLRALSSLWSARPRERLLVDGICSPVTTTTPLHDNNYFSTL